MDNSEFISKEEQDQIDAFADTVKDLVHGDAEDVGAAFAAMSQAAKNLDTDSMLNKIHVPEDAGEHEDLLVSLMKRIPEGWGRWISCGPGWYPLLAEIDTELQKFYPDYEIHQVKEKYGTLCFYYSSKTVHHDPADPPPGERDEGYLAWCRRWREWEKTEEGQKAKAAAKKVHDKVDKIMRELEAKSETICEICGDPGEMSYTLGSSPWHQTLCDAHRAEKDFVTVPQWEEWWKKEGPRIRRKNWEWRREYFRKSHEGKRILVANTDTDYKLQVPAEYVYNIDELKKALGDLTQWDQIWLQADEMGGFVEKVYLDKYADHVEQYKDEHRPPAPENAPDITLIKFSPGNSLMGFHRVGVSVYGSSESALADQEYVDHG